jgi:aminoglycoside 3-N-acetyltransferase|tara:strand:+ start:893 stop:1747 length:855 start_codon:yes stop_codon:yes gene_type:complete
MAEKILFQSNQGPVTSKTFLIALQNSGVSRGDILMVHSQLFSLGKLGTVKKAELLNTMINTLLQAVGKTGSLIFPTFTRSFCKTGFFDILSSKSEGMGILSEEVRSWPGAKRSLHPIYSVCIIGPASENLKKPSAETCFGDNSIFDLLHQLNQENKFREKIKFLTIGFQVPPRAVTYIHYLEEKMRVPYRYFKEFSGIMINNRERILSRTKFFVRDIERKVRFNSDACWKLWQEKRIASTQQLGNSLLCLIDEKRLHNVTIDAIREKNDFLCIGGYNYPTENSS